MQWFLLAIDEPTVVETTDATKDVQGKVTSGDVQGAAPAGYDGPDIFAPLQASRAEQQEEHLNIHDTADEETYNVDEIEGEDEGDEDEDYRYDWYY